MRLLVIFGYIFLEIYSLMLLADAIGGFPTLLWVFVAAGIGVWLIRENGRDNIQRMMMGMQQGVSPQESLLDNLFILFAGLLLISPGVFSDIIALFLLIPPIRHLFFGRTMRFVQAKGQKIYANNTSFFTFFGGPSGFDNAKSHNDFTTHQQTYGQNGYEHQTMDAEYVVKEQAPRKTTAVIIESEPINGGSKPSSGTSSAGSSETSTNGSTVGSPHVSSDGSSNASSDSSSENASDSRQNSSR